MVRFAQASGHRHESLRTARLNPWLMNPNKDQRLCRLFHFILCVECALHFGLTVK
jgi:hypothetical protein